MARRRPHRHRRRRHRHRRAGPRDLHEPGGRRSDRAGRGGGGGAAPGGGLPRSSPRGPAGRSRTRWPGCSATASVVGLANHTLLIARRRHRAADPRQCRPDPRRAAAIIGVVLVFRDDTERRGHERELRGGEPPQGRVPGDAGPRAPQPAGRDPARPSSCSTRRRPRTTSTGPRGSSAGRSSHLARLLDDLLDVSRITRGMILVRKELDRRSPGDRPRRRRRSGPLIEERGTRFEVAIPPRALQPGGRPGPAGAGPGQPPDQRRQVHRRPGAGSGSTAERDGGPGRHPGRGHRRRASRRRCCRGSSTSSPRGTGPWPGPRAGWASA